MHVSQWLVAGVVEIYLLLLVLCLFLVFNIRHLRKIIGKLKHKIAKLAKEVKEAKAAKSEAESLTQTLDQSYASRLKQQIDITNDYKDSLTQGADHASSHPSEDTALNHALDFRRAVLSTELAAQSEENAGDLPNWNAIQVGFNRIIKAYRAKKGQKADASEADLDTSESASVDCVRDLLVEAAGGKTPDNIEVMLERFKSSRHLTSPKVSNSELSHDKAQDLANLRALAEKQQRTIKELQSRIQNASTPVDLKNLVNDLNVQLNRQTQFLKESEGCIKSLEEELELANAKVTQLQHRLKRGGIGDPAVDPGLQRELTSQNEKLKNLVKQQQAEIDQLCAQMDFNK